MEGKLFILCGASGCGKSTLLNSIPLNEYDMDLDLKAIRAPKFSDRRVREKNEDMDDIINEPSITLDNFDIAYIINNTKYGIKLHLIYDLLNKGINLFIIISNFLVIKQLKSILGSQVKTLYISSALDIDKLKRIQIDRMGFSPKEEEKKILSYHFNRISAAARLNWWGRVTECMIELEKDWSKYAEFQRLAENRAQKLNSFNIRYSENIWMFDNVILNNSENNPEEMVKQVKILLNKYNKENFDLKKIYPPIFIVAAASGAGKGSMMEMLNFIGSNKIKITSKLSKRKPKSKDKDDGMIAIKRGLYDPEPIWPEWWSPEMINVGKNGEFPPQYDIRWDFHRHDKFIEGTQYAVSSTEIQRNIDNNFPQIFISNIGMFEIFKNKWPNNCVFIYLHRWISVQENRDYQMQMWKEDIDEAEARIQEYERVHSSYIENICQFDHVLLNTGFLEDLYDQIFQLIEFYKK